MQDGIKPKGACGGRRATKVALKINIAHNHARQHDNCCTGSAPTDEEGLRREGGGQGVAEGDGNDTAGLPH